MTVRGVLLDLEGVLYQGDAPIPGAVEAVRRLGDAGLGLRFLTNTTTRPRSHIVARMRAIGFAVDPADVFSPAMAAGRSLRRAGVHRIHLAAPESLAADFTGFELVDERVDAVVLGDLHTEFTWLRLNRLFGMLLAGARLVALHKNRFCRREEGLGLDLGPFVAALEYAAGTTAAVMGKPSPAFFAMALESLGLAADETVMVGDDIEADIGGARAAGIYAVQVETGKYSPRDRAHPSIAPDARIRSIRELPELIRQLT
ncbi:MAG: TIGR01458 family HAD-type hydrolase [Alphaproteobacteria bacterium]